MAENSKYNRSLTMHSTAIEFQKKPYLQIPLERNGSFKKLYNSSFQSVKGKVKNLCSLFESTKSPTSVLHESISQTQPQTLANLKSVKPSDSWVSSILDDSSIRLPGAEDQIVVYFTSLRGIRGTYEDCCAVRLILRGFRVVVDERDVLMDLAYKKELQGVLGQKSVNLPQVFIRGKYIGGADVIKQLHEVGELGKMVKGIPIQVSGYVCEGCGDVRFVLRSNCNGSGKIYDEDEDQLKRCLDCNENGLVRCPACCS